MTFIGYTDLTYTTLLTDLGFDPLVRREILVDIGRHVECSANPKIEDYQDPITGTTFTSTPRLQ